MSALGITDPQRALRRAAVIRLTFGVAGLLRPGRTCTATGIADADRTEETEYLMRVVASRDLLLAFEHLAAARRTEDHARVALRGAALTGLADAAATVAELLRRGAPRGGLRAGLTFLVTDGIGFPVLWWLAERRQG